MFSLKYEPEISVVLYFLLQMGPSYTGSFGIQQSVNPYAPIQRSIYTPITRYVQLQSYLLNVKQLVITCYQLILFFFINS